MKFVRFFVPFLFEAILLPQCGDINRRYFGSEGESDFNEEEGIDPSVSPDTAVFPHPDNWNETHRPWVKANGPDFCLKCHTREGSDDPDALPGCFSCHPYPHPKGAAWSLGEHSALVEEKGLDECRKCHGADLKTPQNQKTCYSCHTFPHLSGWKGPVGSPQPHAQAVYDGTVSDCTSCHALQKGGIPNRNPSCADCHTFSYPHAENWVLLPGNTQPHGQEVLASGSGSCARSSCHGNGTQVLPSPGNQGPACSTGGCHGSVYPHSANIRSGLVHGGPATLNIANCKTCHGTGLDQAPAGFQSCVNCHSSLPLHNFAATTDANWEETHGAWIRADRVPRMNQCRVCHGEELRGGVADVSCFSCHDHLEGAPAGWMAETNPLHALTFISQMEAGTTPTCQRCHGENYDRPLGPDRQSCVTCHTTGVTHVSRPAAAWDSGAGHGAYFLQHESTNPFSTCRNCHQDGPGAMADACNTCHGEYPHDDPAWAAGGTATHAAHFIELVGAGQTAECTQCHGGNYDRELGPEGQSCITCHTGGVTHTALARWRAGPGHGAYYIQNETGDASSACRTCHQPAPAGTATACIRCHNGDYPHDDLNWATPPAPTHAAYFIEKVRTGRESDCTVCHGEDLDRPVTRDGLSCQTCHTSGIFHRNEGGVPWSDGSLHGISFSSRFTSDDEASVAFCWSCHGEPVSFQAAYVSTPPVDTEAERTAEREHLAEQSSCYGCHEAYPHRSWEGGPWRPWGHASFLFDSPLLTDEDGNAPPSGGAEGDPIRLAALERTCGSEGGCHTEGQRSFRTTDAATGLCGVYCHSPSRPWEPTPRNETPPAASSVIAGPPAITSTNPVAGATDVPVIIPGSTRGGIIFIYFNESMDASTVTGPGTVTLRKVSDSSLVDIQRVVCNNAGSVWCGRASIQPTARLAYSTRYRVTVTRAAKDWGGEAMAADYSWEFTTVAADITPPTVVSTNPTAGSTAVPITTRVVTVTFNEPLTPFTSQSVGSGTCATARMCLKRGTTVIPGTVACDGTGGATDCRTVRFTRTGTAALPYETVYTVFVRGVRDLSSNLMVGTHTFTFTTDMSPEEW